MNTNPGKIKIVINEGRSISIQPGVSLLQALKQNNVFLSSACGGRGICGLCRLKVIEGAPPELTPAETVHINPEEIRANFRLACQVNTDRDLRISIPDSFFNAREFRAEVLAIRDLTRDIKEFTLRLAKPPEIAFNGPHGDFYLRAGAGDIIMIAGGSGMAPIKSMLADMRDRKMARKTRFFFGGRTPADIFYRELMSQFEAALPHFQFIPIVSGILPGEKWEGKTGLITEVIERRIEDGFAEEAYLCGSPAMIAVCVAVLCRKNVSEERIYYDKFA